MLLKEKNMNGAKYHNGMDWFIPDVTSPLMGALQEKQGVISLPASCPSQSIVDVSENMRAKIYSIFCKIGKCSDLMSV